MRFQPVNPNSALPNCHELYVATSGGGKSVMLRHNLAKLPKNSRVILWDQADDHAGLHCATKQSFVRALKAGYKSSRGFRIAFNGPATIENFEWFCEVVWSKLDGNHLTHMVVEELSQVSPSINRASPNAEVLLNQMRKYGGIFHGTTQKPQATAKTYYDLCEIKYIGQQKTEAMCRKMASEIGGKPEAIKALQPLNFYFDDGKAGDPELIKVKFKGPTGVKHAKAK